MYKILNESRRDDMLLPYVNLLRGKGINTNVSQLKQFLLKKFVNEGLMRNLSLGSNFYLAGVARYYFNGDLTTNKVLNVFDENQTDEFKQDICERLNACILVLRNAHIDSVGTSFEQPEDFGELKLMALLRKYNAKINQVLGIVPDKKKEVAKKEVVLDENPSVGNGYTFDILYSYEDARKYNKFTEPGAWCITYGEQHFNSYVRNRGIHYVIFRQDGFENVPRKTGPNFTKRKPHDEYGNSLIALLQSNKNGEPDFITSRWNHGSGRDGTQGTEADRAYTKEEFCRITGVNDADLQRIFKIWQEKREVKKRENAGNGSLTKKKTLNALRYVKYGQMRMNGGEDVRSVFKGVSGGFLTGKRDGTIKNCISVLQIPIWGDDPDEPENIATVLCDKGKMIFETFKLHTEGFYGTHRMYQSSDNRDDWSASRFNNLILITQENYHQFYDTKRHKLIDINGVTKFKYISSGPASWKADGTFFYEVAQSGGQRALINYQTNIPLRLPNGEYWMEEWESIKHSSNGYRRDVNVTEIDITDKMLKIVYDSAANLIYYYDLATKRFFQPEEYEGYKIARLSSGKSIYNDAYAVLYMGDNSGESFYKLYKGGKPTQILGYNEFRTIYNISNENHEMKIFGLRPLNVNHTMFFDCVTESEIEFYDYSGERVFPQGASNTGMSGDKQGLIWLSFEGFRYDVECLYDVKQGRFLLNPYTKSYIFNQYSSIIDKEVWLRGAPYVDINQIKPEQHKNYCRQRCKITIDYIRRFTDEYASKIGSIPRNENEAKEDFIRKINAGEINASILSENKQINGNEINFIIENILKQLGDINNEEKTFIKENIERQLLSEINVVDAYQRFYQKIPQEDYKTIVFTIQGNNLELHQDTKWVLGLYKRWGKTVIEDLYKLHNDEGTGALDIFRRARDRRMTRGIDLNRFKSISELVVWVREELNADEVLGRTKGEMSTAVNKAANDAYFIYEDDIWKVLIPKTYEASCYWGQGTEWCTATRSTDSWYNQYSQQGPLFININKQTGDKYQFHFESEQFMDKDDLSIDEPIFENMDASSELINFYQSYFNDDKEKFFRLKYEIFDDNYYSYKIYKVNSNFYIYSKTYDKFITNEPILDYYIDDNYNDYTIIRLELVEGWVIYNSYYGEVFAENKFDAIGEFDYDRAYVKKGTQLNIINDTAELLSDDWFDDMFKYEGGSNLIQVTDNGKVNLFDLSNRELLLSEWVDDIEYDEDIDFLGIVKKDNKYNLLNDHGEFVLPMFVDDYETNTIFTGSEYLIPIKLNGKWNFCGQYDKKIQSSIWFDDWAQSYSFYSDHDMTVEVNGETYKVYFEKGYMQNEETWEKVRI